MESMESHDATPAHFALGALRFSISGRHPVVDCLLSEFAALRLAHSDRAPHVRFRFCAGLEPMSGASRVQPLTILSDRFALNRRRLSYEVVQRSGGIDVNICISRFNAVRRMAPAGLARITSRNYLTRAEAIAKSFVYDLFDYVSQIAQLPLGQSHLHASSFERDGCGVAIIAWGGVGKTTALLKLVLEDGWRYLSDDLVTIDRDGTLWRSPKNLQVYGYNVTNEAGLRSALMAGRSLADRAAWTIHGALRGPKRVRRRVSAERLFGATAVATSAPLRHAIHIQRAESRTFRIRETTADDVARRAAATVLKELDPFVDLSLALHSGEHHPVLPAVEAMHAATCDVLVRALSTVQPLTVVIPLTAGPDEIADCLRDLLPSAGRQRAAAGAA